MTKKMDLKLVYTGAGKINKNSATKNKTIANKCKKKKTKKTQNDRTKKKNNPLPTKKKTPKKSLKGVYKRQINCFWEIMDTTLHV